MEPKVELLAPAGTWEAFEAVIEAGADAVYLGGKRFNMRMHRQDFNFDDQQLKKAVTYAHERGVKLYVTVNNLLTDEQLKEVEEFLLFLDDIGVDAVIIQDLALLDLLQEIKPSFEIHASVMMNTSNLDTLRYLKDRGVTRVVTSREITLAQINTYSEQIDMEFEYFVHGDMCYAQSGQCLHSGVLFGNSSNQGRCLKPCRWPFKLEGEDEYSYPLAVKDMCMFYHLRELIQSGVQCFKVEGRMRPPAFLKDLIAKYRSEIDAYLADPTGYAPNKEAGKELQEERVRDYSTCFAFGNPGPAFIDSTGQREPRQFSKAKKEPQISRDYTKKLKVQLQKGIEDTLPKGQARLTVVAPTLEHLEVAIEKGIQRIIIGGDCYRPQKPWSIDEVKRALQLGRAYDREIIYRTPSIMMEREMNDFKMFLKKLSEERLWIMTGNIGVIASLYTSDLHFNLYGDLGLNLNNSRTAGFLKRQGFESAILSLEAGVQEVIHVGQKSPLEMEIMVQGPIRGMVSDNCPGYDPNGLCKLDCTQGLILEDEAGCKHRMEFDQYCRNHIFFQNHLGLLPILGQLVANGYHLFRIDSTFYSPEKLEQIIDIYKRTIRFDYEAETIEKAYEELVAICPAPLTYGALVTKKD